MFMDLDRKVELDIYVTIVATVVSVDFIVFSFIWKDYASQILSVLVIILPTIYIVGNLIIRGIIDREVKDLRKEYEEGLIEVSEGIDDMWDEIELLTKERSKNFI